MDRASTSFKTTGVQISSDQSPSALFPEKAKSNVCQKWNLAVAPDLPHSALLALSGHTETRAVRQWEEMVSPGRRELCSISAQGPVRGCHLLFLPRLC